MSEFVWTAELEAKARRRYVEDLRPPTFVARCVGGGCKGPDVRALAEARGWNLVGRRSRKVTPGAATLATMRRLYVEELRSPAEVAAILGPPFTAQKVRRQASGRGWGLDRPQSVTNAHKAAALQAALPLAIAARRAAAVGRVRDRRPAVRPARARPPARVCALGEGREVPDEIRAAIDTAVAAGKVTVLPTMYAAGLTAPERHFWAAGSGGSWKAQQDRSRRA